MKSEEKAETSFLAIRASVIGEGLAGHICYAGSPFQAASTPGQGWRRKQPIPPFQRPKRKSRSGTPGRLPRPASGAGHAAGRARPNERPPRRSPKASRQGPKGDDSYPAEASAARSTLKGGAKIDELVLKRIIRETIDPKEPKHRLFSGPPGGARRPLGRNRDL